jgi:hypothetical protein
MILHGRWFALKVWGRPPPCIPPLWNELPLGGSTKSGDQRKRPGSSDTPVLQRWAHPGGRHTMIVEQVLGDVTPIRGSCVVRRPGFGVGMALGSRSVIIGTNR